MKNKRTIDYQSRYHCVRSIMILLLLCFSNILFSSSASTIETSDGVCDNDLKVTSQRNNYELFDNQYDNDASPLQLSIKTNAVAWALMVSNIGVEIEFLPRWSFSLPFYYSGVNYFTGRVKFRILGIQPEVRYSFTPQNENGFIVGAHFGIAKYNFAIGGKYRFQDHNGQHPAVGGGLSVAYRMNLDSKKRWKVEFSAGAGLYHLYTDHYTNDPNGWKVYSSHSNKFVIDNVGVNFLYTFNL